MPHVTLNFYDRVAEVLKEHGIDHFGIDQINSPHSFAVYEDWLKKGFAGEMAYLEKHKDLKRDITTLAPFSKSIISVAFPYHEHPKPDPSLPKTLTIARYARGLDYHHWFKSKLQAVAQDLKTQFVGDEFLCFTDSHPILERDTAWRLGLGWFGKNSMLIHPKRGSFFLLGEIVTSVSVESSPPKTQTDHCGTCTRCIDHCPTTAILPNRTLNATRCISYWTIESRNVPPENLRSQFKGWFFGCDICQDVCPWNEKVFGKKSAFRPDRAALVAEVTDILTSSNKQLTKRFKNTPLSRAGGFGLKRNALIVAANEALTEITPVLDSIEFENEALNELKNWVRKNL